MSRRNALAHFKSAVGLTLTAISIAVGLAGPAAAAPIDQVFLDRLQSIGITSSNPYATVGYAHGACRQLSLGTPHSRVVDYVMSDYPTFDRESAADFVVTAYMTYCPENGLR